MTEELERTGVRLELSHVLEADSAANSDIESILDAEDTAIPSSAGQTSLKETDTDVDTIIAEFAADSAKKTRPNQVSPAPESSTV